MGAPDDDLMNRASLHGALAACIPLAVCLGTM
jgi:hypothetical protein